MMSHAIRGMHSIAVSLAIITYTMFNFYAIGTLSDMPHKNGGPWLTLNEGGVKFFFL